MMSSGRGSRDDLDVGGTDRSGWCMRSERRRAREAAMRALYQMDMSGCSPEWAVAFAVNDSADLDLPNVPGATLLNL